MREKMRFSWYLKRYSYAYYYSYMLQHTVKTFAAIENLRISIRGQFQTQFGSIIKVTNTVKYVNVTSIDTCAISYIKKV